MIVYAILGFLSGGLIPFMAGRFGKLIPLDPGLLLLRIPHKPHFPKSSDPMRQYLLRQKWKKLLLVSLLWAFSVMALFCACFYLLPIDFISWGCLFCWILTISIVIDAQYWLLPDFFTLPLLLMGIFFAYQHPQIGVQTSLVGACGGYLLSVFSVFFLGLFSKNPQFGGGDVKMLTALGAWLGILGLDYTLIVSFPFFIIFNALPIQKKGAYGPALGTAALLLFFTMYAK